MGDVLLDDRNRRCWNANFVSDQLTLGVRSQRNMVRKHGEPKINHAATKNDCDRGVIIKASVGLDAGRCPAQLAEL